MKIFVRVRAEWLTVPVAKETVRWLGEEAVRRYSALQPPSHVNRPEKVFQIKKTKNGAILHPEDKIVSVLTDEEYITVILESDLQSSTTNVNISSGFACDGDPLYSSSLASAPHVHHMSPVESLVLDGNSLTTKHLVQLGRGKYRIELSEEAWAAVSAARAVVDEIVATNQTVYGVTTGFGRFASVVIEKEKLQELQENLIRSHAAGVGKPLSPERTRMLLSLRINILAKGFSGISPETLQKLVDAFNASCLPWVPEQGTVGASGDLAPLSHLALGMLGEGIMWSPKSGWADARFVLEANGLTPLRLKPKEGLALINGTQLITSLGAEAVERCEAIARQADVVAALSLEVLKGTSRAFDSDIHAVRRHPGQVEVAGRFRALLSNHVFKSEIAASHRFCNKVQDAYTLRCCPQVHGITQDTIQFAHNIILTELNSATDNPMVLASRGEIISAGNFHGEYPAKALDYLAIGVHELANISERRTERLMNPTYSGLPAFLVKDGGLNSGFMIAHCTAASLTSENKVLCHPSSVDSLSTSAGQEDHVSMGGFSARKSLRVVEHVEQVLAIELLAACQAMEFLRPLKTTAPLEAVYRLVREKVPAWERDRYMAPDIVAATALLRSEKVWQTVAPYIAEYESLVTDEMRPTSPTAFCIGQQRKRLTSASNGSPTEIPPTVPTAAAASGASTISPVPTSPVSKRSRLQ
ncbi:hypothetical protein BOX15_Mlig010907g2 [Macrostomum lignano]|uniref:Uncharacterized protein n=3 Tax=Macrostomum lignano TaxID=282301 RepID=A0A267F4U2_9PLAT|nr:hypothetical protein BOX15_Mlig010907g1 [Macrostomum lignano]PAA93334.1 hypothetical protein BOX15_Mlig010907g2 [Macrostomum lignano]